MSITEFDERSQQKQFSKIIIENINSLNDDCLMHIFENLPLREKLIIEMVCSRWNRLGRRSWSNENTFGIGEFYNPFVENSKNINKIINFYENILIRCGFYVKNILIVDSEMLSNKKLVNLIVNYCSDIQKIAFLHETITGIYDDDDLKLLFNNIQSIFFQNITINGHCFEYLPAEKLQDLEMLNCDILNEDHFYELLSKAKNLKKLRIQSYDIDPARIFNALDNCNCYNICELSLSSAQGTKINFNKEFIEKQKNLSKISLHNVSNSKEIIKILVKDNLEEIKYVEFNQELFRSLVKCPKLRTLILYFENNDFKTFYTKFFKILSEIIDVRFIKFSKCICIISSDRSLILKSLVNFSGNDVLNKHNLGISSNIDKLLDNVRLCKNLETLNIGDCNFTGLGITYIKKFKNLKNLNISLNNKMADDWLVSIITKLVKLEKIFLYFCPLITNNSIKQANEIKRKRNDIKKLKIFCYGTRITKNVFDDNDDFMIILNDSLINLKI